MPAMFLCSLCRQEHKGTIKVWSPMWALTEPMWICENKFPTFKETHKHNSLFVNDEIEQKRKLIEGTFTHQDGQWQNILGMMNDCAFKVGSLGITKNLFAVIDGHLWMANNYRAIHFGNTQMVQEHFPQVWEIYRATQARPSESVDH